jgi:uncharacterized alkaline shock family protein YloU
MVEAHRHKLKTLVSRRIEIAHGKQNVTMDLNYYVQYEMTVYNVMYELALRIDERLNSPPYATL